jgi:copper chaperone CopZ
MIRAYRVHGLRCAHCVEILRRDLGRIPGVRRVSIAPADQLVSVEYNPYFAKDSLLVAAMRDAGFHPAELPVREEKLENWLREMAAKTPPPADPGDSDS